MIGVLNAYHWDLDPNSYQVAYRPMFEDFLKIHFPNEEVRFYEVPAGEVPHSPEECECWFISGSAKSAYENDEWIVSLKNFIKKCHQEKVKMVGFCFGHQIISEALGGKVEKSENGWGVGIRAFEIIESQSWMKDAKPQLRLIYSHQDQVSSLPPGAQHIGKSDFCEFEAFQIEDHILCFQGHPEFTAQYAIKRYQSRADNIGQKRFEEAIASMGGGDDSQVVWNWLDEFLKL